MRLVKLLDLAAATGGRVLEPTHQLGNLEPTEQLGNLEPRTSASQAARQPA
ncbi:MAG: hypothetical protein ACRDPA_04135 [Solirubrobacteraceae bacterium]